MGTALQFDDLVLGYDRHPAVHHLSGGVADGAMLALVGPNGAGKSTLLKGIAGEIRPLSGRLRHGDAARAGGIACLPQRSALDRDFPIAVADMVAMGLWRRRGLWQAFSRGDDRRIGEALAAVGLAGFERRPVGTLSGGQLQRAMFARVLLQDAAVILLDEPFTAIDTRTVADLMRLVERWHGEGRTVIAALHDLDQVRRHFPETLLLSREAIAWGPTAEVLTAENLFRARRAAAWDDHADVCEAAPHGHGTQDGGDRRSAA